MKAFASSESLSSKNPITTTSLPSENFFAASTSVRSVAGGPVRFRSHLTISSAVRPPSEVKIWYVSGDYIGMIRHGFYYHKLYTSSMPEMMC